eukprot:TRINITY_DN61881_c0_g1_i1.p1 TRINITY_DN61881_c0_g1~~TRINITY_DN61881_c0_g1_i1.p1  ORF type:complete len:850 (-),score=193.84 TRINITY_DN61881_c0_g1_i1:173-2722(-)
MADAENYLANKAKAAPENHWVAPPMTASTSVTSASYSPPWSARTSRGVGQSPPQSAAAEPRWTSLFESEFNNTSFSRLSSFETRDPTWRDAQVNEKLHTSRELRQKVRHQFRARPKPAENNWEGTGVAEKLKKRIAETEALVKLLGQRLEGTEFMIRRVNETLVVLSNKRELLEQPIAVCAKRIEIRGHRHDDELVQDEFQDALENEQRILQHSSKRLGDYIRAGKSLLDALEAGKKEVVTAMQFKKHVMRLERSALQFDPYHGRDRACVLPLVSDSSSSKQAVASDDAGNDVLRPEMQEFKFGATMKMVTESSQSSPKASDKKQKNMLRSSEDTEELLQKTLDLEQSCSRFRVEADDLVLTVKRQVQLVSETTRACMMANANKLMAQKQDLEREVARSEEAIGKSKQLLDAIKEEISKQNSLAEEWSNNGDISVLSFDQRLPRPLQEEMRALAKGKLQEQAQLAERNIFSLESRCEEANALLFQLYKSHDQLIYNLENKTEAHNLDVCCMKVLINPKEDDHAALSSVTKPSQQQASIFLDVNSIDGMLRTPKKLPTLDNKTLAMIRGKMRSAAYRGGSGTGFAEIFRKVDRDSSGCLEPEEVKRAIRCFFRIPKTSISDQQIASLCLALDADGSGSISINELVAFVSEESMAGKRADNIKAKLMEDLGVDKVGGAAFELDCMTNNRSRLAKTISSAPSHTKTGGAKRGQALTREVIEKLRMKIKAASYTGHLGREVEATFSRYDIDGSGLLEADEVRMALRRALRIPPSVISDDQIAKLCAMLDSDQSGAISIAEIVEFVGKDPEVSNRTGKMSIVKQQTKKLEAELAAKSLTQANSPTSELDWAGAD